MSKSLGTCPLCNGNIIEKDKVYSCENSKWIFEDDFDEWENHGCDFKIFKNALKKYGLRQINSSKIRTLFQEGRLIVTLKSRYKQTYTKFAYVDNEFGISVDFESDPEKED